MRSNFRKIAGLIGLIAIISLGAIGVALAEDHLASVMRTTMLLGASSLVLGVGAVCAKTLWIRDRTNFMVDVMKRGRDA